MIDAIYMRYRYIAILQVVLTVILFASLPLWKERKQTVDENAGEKRKPIPLKSILKIHGAK